MCWVKEKGQIETFHYCISEFCLGALNFKMVSKEICCFYVPFYLKIYNLLYKLSYYPYNLIKVSKIPLLTLECSISVHWLYFLLLHKYNHHLNSLSLHISINLCKTKKGTFSALFVKIEFACLFSWRVFLKCKKELIRSGNWI
jgi:hypothetical protein